MRSDRTGLADLVDFRQGDATGLPFADAPSDIVWSKHAAMNIPDKPKLYREMCRVLKPGGTLAMYDVLAGPSGPVLCPVPRARTPESSILVTPHELRSLLEKAGLKVPAWSVNTDAARAWFVSLAEKIRNSAFTCLSGLISESWPRISGAISRRGGLFRRRRSPRGKRRPAPARSRRLQAGAADAGR